MIEKIPPKGVSFSDFICTFAAPCYDFRLFSNCNTKISGKCPKFGVIANLEVESVVNTFAVIIHLKLSHYGNDRLRKRV